MLYVNDAVFNLDFAPLPHISSFDPNWPEEVQNKQAQWYDFTTRLIKVSFLLG